MSLRSKIESGVLTLTLNRPTLFNSFNKEMATQCSSCLRETIQGATEVVGNIVLPDSACTSPPFLHHNWVRKAQPPVPGNCEFY
jgi:hypothetical protein